MPLEFQTVSSVRQVLHQMFRSQSAHTPHSLAHRRTLARADEEMILGCEPPKHLACDSGLYGFPSLRPLVLELLGPVETSDILFYNVYF